MFDRTSRYNRLPVLTLAVTDADGTPREIRYVRRRFIPGNPGPMVAQYSVAQGDRLDNITARYLGDPLQFWRVCDSNNILDPEELTDTVGRIIRIALPAS